jgi:Methyltransferase domain
VSSPADRPEFRAVSPEDPAFAGQADYTDRFLRIYDPFVLGLVSRLFWRCSSSRIVELYDRHVSARHMDIGPGTGYFLDRCRFPTPDPQIMLIDLNPTPLEHASWRLRRYRPRTHQANVLEPLRLDGERFDSVGMGYLLHCLPGTMESKAAVFRNLRPFLNPGATVFGSTVLADDSMHNAASRRLLEWNNQRGTFSNHDDTAAALDRMLAAEFGDHELRLRGAVGLFAARVPS